MHTAARGMFFRGSAGAAGEMEMEEDTCVGILRHAVALRAQESCRVPDASGVWTRGLGDSTEVTPL